MREEGFEEKEYSWELTGDAAAGFTIVNSHPAKTVDVVGTKTWVDEGDRYGARPDSITVQLIANGDTADPVAEVTVEPDEDGAWMYAFKGLPEFKDGEKVVHTVREADVPEGYEATADGSSELPQTGDSSLPLPVLAGAAAAGVALVIVGIALVRRR